MDPQCYFPIFKQYWVIAQVLQCHCNMIGFVLLVLPLLVRSTCPTHCRCSAKTLSCVTCITPYYRTYLPGDSTCSCIQGFNDDQHKQYCCHDDCLTCYERGCANCGLNSIMQWNTQDNYYACLCLQDHYRDGKDCRCLSITNPHDYYLDIRDNSCNKCPQLCYCSSLGCVSCKSQAQREIAVTNNGLSICQCQNKLIDIQGLCSVPLNCFLTQDNNVSCNTASNRVLTNLKWECQYPYQDQNGQCQCLPPYYLSQRFGSQRCLCLSKQSITSYFEFQIYCSKCPSGCTCGETGCESCIDLLRDTSSSSCSCSFGSTEVNQECVCLQPFFKDVNGSCVCLSSTQPTLYYTTNYEGTQTCLKCPSGCTCDDTGCVSCGMQTLRVITEDAWTDPPRFSCTCNQTIDTYDINDTCACSQQYYYDNVSQTCLCSNITSPATAYYDADQGYCFLCPTTCFCDQTGCVKCMDQQFRTMKANSNGTLVCPCLPEMVETNFGCQCSNASQYNPSTGKCKCVQPYFASNTLQDFTEYCICKNFRQPNLYYATVGVAQCRACPSDCLCSQFDCYDCAPSALRIIYRIPLFIGVQRFVCYCSQYTIEIDNKCVSCDSNSYFNNNNCQNCTDCSQTTDPECIDCRYCSNCTVCTLCKTCDVNGCLSCNQVLSLYNTTCVCDNEMMVNIQGFCRCPQTQYSDLSQGRAGICKPCPANCLTCNQPSSMLVVCLSCDTNGTNRLDVSESGCPCDNNYKETVIQHAYCCPVLCGDCDQTKCISCPQFSSRSLIKGQCVCAEPFVDEGMIVCGCPPLTYYFNESCLACPPRCGSCFYNQSLDQAVCSSCRIGANRDPTSNNCTCLNGFVETNPPGTFCYAIGCLAQEQVCSKCQDTKVPDQNGLCVCPGNQYYQKRLNRKCATCPIPGCLKCNVFYTCLQCDSSQGYYLVSSVCIAPTKTSYLIYQDQADGLFIQTNVSKTTAFTSISATLYIIQTKKAITSSLPVKIRSFRIKDNILSIIMQNPQQDHRRAIISIQMAGDGVQLNYNSFYNIEVDDIRSQADLQRLQSFQFAIISSLAMVFVVVSLVFAIFGYKHNQLMYIMQTFTLLGLCLGQKRQNTATTLFNMKLSCFMYGSPFARWIPTDYLESSKGNFKWMTRDSNLLRVAGAPILITSIIMLVALGMYLGFDTIKPKVESNGLFTRVYKRAFRFFQFFFFGAMFPILFLSINTLFNYGSLVHVSRQFKWFCFGLSIFMILLYALLVVFYLRSKLFSKLYRLQLLVSLFYSCITSIVLVALIDYDIVMMILLGFCFVTKDLIYYLLLVYVAKTPEYVRIKYQSAAALSQVVPLFLIYFDQPVASIVLIFVALLVWSLVETVVITLARKEHELEKIRIAYLDFGSQSESVIREA